MKTIQLTKNIALKSAEDGYSLFFRDGAEWTATVNLNAIANSRNSAVKRTMYATLENAFEPAAFTREMYLAGEEPSVGSKVVVRDFAGEGILKEVSGRTVEIVAHIKSTEGYDSLVFKWLCHIKECYMYHALVTGNDNFLPVDNRSDAEALHDDLVAVMTEDGVLRGDKSIASEAIARVIDSGKFTIGYK